MNDAVPILCELYLSKICQRLQECYKEFTVIMDGTPVFAKAECVVLRCVHMSTKRIHEFVVHLGLYSKSLDGITIATHVT